MPESNNSVDLVSVTTYLLQLQPLTQYICIYTMSDCAMITVIVTQMAVHFNANNVIVIPKWHECTCLVTENEFHTNKTALYGIMGGLNLCVINERCFKLQTAKCKHEIPV